MTGTELLRVRTALGLSQASVAAMCGGLGGAQAGTSTVTAAQIASSEAGGSTSISNPLGSTLEACFRTSLNAQTF